MVLIKVTPFRALITLLITYLLSPLPLQVGFRVLVILAWLGRFNSFRSRVGSCNLYAKGKCFWSISGKAPNPKPKSLKPPKLQTLKASWPELFFDSGSRDWSHRNCRPRSESPDDPEALSANPGFQVVLWVLPRVCHS